MAGLAAFIYGYPVGHSISPAMHNAAFEALALDVHYAAREVAPDDLPMAVGALRERNVVGANITVPHKEAVMELVDELDEQARSIGAANTIQNRDGRLLASNTDAVGFARSLAGVGFEPTGASVLLLGAGGSARAVSHALLGAGARRLVIANRSSERGRRLASQLRVRFGRAQVESVSPAALVAADVAGCSLVVNTTTVGLGDNETPLPAELLPAGGLVVDIIYRPTQTRLLREARRLGLPILNGLPMLVHQAAAAWELWMGRPAPLGVMQSAAETALGGQ
jgi:shikimate dehydrogenase